ncbi:glycosyltransferase family 2 protein [Sphingomonas sp. ID0503]|uniref:glycosyltransferase family 2 protein n=1 Tax=Sphingomonas sp. ID0503 TaxID=3399691 RepID=UPI003AFA1A7B
MLTAGTPQGNDTLYPFAVPLPDGRPSQMPALRAVEATTGLALGEPVTIVPPAGDNLLANPAFREWVDNAPVGWTVPASLLQHLMPAGGATDNGIQFNLSDFRDEKGLRLLSAKFSIRELGEGRRLDLLIDQHLSESADIGLTLRLETPGGDFADVKAELVASAGYSNRLARLILPKPAADYAGTAELEIALTGPVPEGYAILQVGIGAVGFTVEDSPDAIPQWAAVNAIRHGDFTKWTGSLRQGLNKRQLSVTEGWAAFGRVPNPQAEILLDRIEARDPAKGIGAEDVYALTIRGKVESGSIRLDTDLDVAALFRRPPTLLSFFAACSQKGQIDEISVVVRQADPSDAQKSTTRRITSLARRLTLSRAGRQEQVMIPPDRADIIQETAQAVLRDPNAGLFLSFTFAGLVDASLAKLTLTRAVENDEAGDGGFIGFEDPRITNQLAHLQMVSAWTSREPISPLRPAGGQPLLPWKRPERDFPSIDIVICVYNAHDEVAACLDSVLRNTNVPHTLTIIDDGSELVTRSMLRRFAEGKPWVRLRPNEENLGYTRSANRGLASSDAAWVVLLNSDTIVTPQWLERMMECALSDPQIAFVGPVSNAATWQSVPDVKDDAGGWKVNTLPDGFGPAEMARVVSKHSVRQRPVVPLLNGFCTLMKTSVLEELGYLDERSFPMGYGEESDLCVRAQKAGHHLVIADDVYVYHSKSASFGSERRKQLSRAGNEALRAKHPDTNFQALQNQLAESVPLIELRKALRQAIAAL